MSAVLLLRPTTACVLASMLLAGIAGCTSIERSRSFSDERVSASTTALQVCSNCHGVKGISTSPNFPHLAAQSPGYLEAQLKAFRGHGRADPGGFEYMWGISAKLSDRQIAGLSRYFSQQPAATGYSSDPVREQRGKAIFADGISSSGVPACASCHGAHGEGMGAFPRLAGQHADYISKQLTAFQRTDERPDSAIMQSVAHALTNDDIASLASYVESIRSND
ncbi:cytochrome c4 [Duganella sp. BJB488]|uniref:c-type cytochrome n=1 Tax=unclassified Duganella TaxID=2636909 RepID=UPI000E34557F|nr:MULTISPECIES: c-type cytochrome [unclassified Duganella]RFP08500.1 cytochrome c4 [Duganella sp. BJB489]RFP10935.1 cytochrome c4 [Duganella sp. BJB488]RFP27862.1 cytochrome c4 [Duganella sp. BJB480]